MDSSVTRKILQNGFGISILLHLLLLLALLTLVNSRSEEKKQLLPHEYVPAYTYSGSLTPSSPMPVAQQKKQEKPVKTVDYDESESSESIETMKQSDSRLHFPREEKKISVKKISHAPQQKSMLSASFDTMKETQMQEVSRKKEAEPMYMIGDDSQPADPLIKLLGRSLSAHFRYPRMAGELGIHGRVVIGLTLHPEGYYSDIEMMQSSDNKDLDAAALYAVNSAPRIAGADRFISRPKHFVIGFVFN